ncbi:MAG: methyltransferase domain-containing protein, partial [Synergistaceae bacterium]|nr:methyltransferase domain-containing protein [Synergistaceae bacterium]
VTGLDIQSDLIQLARKNADENNFASSVNFVDGDLRDEKIFARESFDGVVINPPYSSTFAGRESSSLSRSTARLETTCTPDDVGEFASRVLKSRGRLFAVFASPRLDVFMNSMTRHNMTPKRLKPVYPKRDQDSGIFLIECVKRGGQGLMLMPPLIIRDEAGNYTRELLDAYKL